MKHHPLSTTSEGQKLLTGEITKHKSTKHEIIKQHPTNKSVRVSCQTKPIPAIGIVPIRLTGRDNNENLISIIDEGDLYEKNQ